jgi:aspartate racemase
MNHLGVLGHSAEGAALFVTEFCRLADERLGLHQHPDLSLDLRPYQPCLPAYERGDLATVRAYMVEGLQRLTAAGAEFFVCPDNTVHAALEAEGPEFPMPGLHLPDVVSAEARRWGFRKVGVLGTRWTMASDLYPRALAAVGVETAMPDQAARTLIDRVIFDELVHGQALEESCVAFGRVIGDLAGSGCDAVALACTEIPLLVTPKASPLPTLDSTRLLAAAALRTAVGDVPLPTWRGGPTRQ